MPTIPTAYKVRTSRMGGGARVQYPCPGCGHDLHSPLDEAGQADTCPNCGAGFVVPGEAELAAQRQAGLAERKKRELKAASRHVPTPVPRTDRKDAARKAEREAKQSRTDGIALFGMGQLAIGTVVLLYFLGMETTAGDVHNIGLLNDRLVEVLVAGFVLVMGTINVAVGRLGREVVARRATDKHSGGH